MSPYSTLSQFIFFQAAVTFAAPHIPRASTIQSQGIQWTSCEIPGQTMPMLCSILSVPLDYLAPNLNETIELNLYKVAAVKQPSRGSILLNFGGPGADSASSLAPGADRFHRYTGGSFDLVAFDPRGTVPNTLPFSCFGTPEETTMWLAQNRFDAANASDTAIGNDWAIASLYTDTCKTNSNFTSYGSFIGSAYTARDFISVVDALGEDGLLRYWGISYGTALGATIAAMFPDRIDRMLLDAVQNIHEYWHYYDVEMSLSTDRTFSTFLEGCFEAGKEKCALARSNKTASAFEDEFYHWLEEDLKYHPFAGPGFVIDYTTVKGLILTSLYTHTWLPALAEFLDAAMKGESSDADLSGTASVSAGEPRFGIACADKTIRTDDVDDVIPALEEMAKLSRIGGDTWASFAMQCAQWPTESKERYLGDFNVQTKNPLLMIGNTYDPVTPFASAKNASDSFPGSVALEHKGFGHGAVAQTSLCTASAIQEYFVDGKLPAPGTVCEVDEQLFSNITWRDILPKPSA